MTVHHTLICLFFFMLQDGNIGLIYAEIPIFRGTEGQSITVPCNFTRTGSQKYFCKDESEERTRLKLINDCDREERILEMDGISHKRGRYSMRYKTTNTGSRLYVTITQLTKSDSGRYTCALDIPRSIDPFQQFRIIVTDAPSTSKPKLTLRPFSTSLPTASTTTTTTTTTSPKTTNQSEEEQTETTAGSGLLLYVALTLAIIVLLFSVALLIFCKKRSSGPKEQPEETEYANFTETEGDSSDVVYTQVDFSNRPAASHSSAPSVQVDNVIYSAPR